jgi:hypothetical protein
VRRFTVFAFSCTGLALVGPALADTLRCGSVLIEPGDDAGYVLRNCGEPESAPAVAGPIPDEDAGLESPAEPFRADRWRYDRGSGKFPVVVVIGDDGRVAAIHFERQRG